MKNKSQTILFVLMLLVGLCQAQEDQPVLSPDRPGYTWGAEVLALHKISWENGFGFESSPDGARTTTLNTTILRYGLFENMELRVGTDFLMLNDGLSPESTFGVSPVTFGTKLKVYESNSWLPSIGLLAEFSSPHLGSKDLRPSHIAPSVYALFEHSINDRLWLCYNAGLEWDGETATPLTVLSMALGFSITDEVGAFIDSYNYFHPDDGNQYMTEIGVTWMVSRRLQLDLECDLDWQQLGKYYSFGGGIAWMIN